MQLSFDKTKRRLVIQSETPGESTELKLLVEQMKKYDAGVNLTYPGGKAKAVLTPVTARFVLATRQFVEEQTAR